MECFDHPQLFHTAQCHVYGKRETVQLMGLALLWKPLGDWLLFIFAITSRDPIVLMCSDLTLTGHRQSNSIVSGAALKSCSM
ncbi:MAG: hypothetical protein R3F37_18285 [Candidatus Competibacteraceae bacterium]